MPLHGPHSPSSPSAPLLPPGEMTSPRHLSTKPFRMNIAHLLALERHPFEPPTILRALLLLKILSLPSSYIKNTPPPKPPKQKKPPPQQKKNHHPPHCAHPLLVAISLHCHQPLARRPLSSQQVHPTWTIYIAAFVLMHTASSHCASSCLLLSPPEESRQNAVVPPTFFLFLRRGTLFQAIILPRAFVERDFLSRQAPESLSAVSFYCPHPFSPVLLSPEFFFPVLPTPRHIKDSRSFYSLTSHGNY